MKKFITLSCLLLTATLVQAQWWGSGIKGNGEVVKITRSVGEYDQVNVGGSFDVIVQYGTEGTITLEGESNLLDYIITEVRGTALKIKVEDGKNIKPSMRKGIVITVPFTELDEVTLAGSGDVDVKDKITAQTFTTAVAGSGDLTVEVEAQRINGNLAGSGDLTISGTTQNFETSVAGSGDVHAENLKAKDVNARIAGSGDIAVYCDGVLTARVSGSGDIRYRGNPSKQDTKVSGSGSISN